MKNILPILLFIILTLFSNCSVPKPSALTQERSVSSISGELVELSASQADSYIWGELSSSWRQLFGIKVILVDADRSSVSFISPVVQREETLVFEVQTLLDGEVTIETITLIVRPLKENATDSNETTPVVTPPTSNDLLSLTLSVANNSLSLDSNTRLKVIATYKDKSVKDVTNEVEWIVSDSDAIEINKRHLRTKEETNIILQAELNNVISNPIALEISLVINGHRLPPEPDETLNDSTLLGIDVNDNGVRDDVERWIYKKYQDKHPVHIDIAMQTGRAYKLVLETPEKALEIHDEVNAALYCELYYKNCINEENSQKKYLSENEYIHSKYFREELYFNTRSRFKTYIQYDSLLSGNSYTLTRCSKRKILCDFNTTAYEDK